MLTFSQTAKQESVSKLSVSKFTDHLYRSCDVPVECFQLFSRNPKLLMMAAAHRVYLKLLDIFVLNPEFSHISFVVIVIFYIPVRGYFGRILFI